jgi:AcrR family transcriptional regulator
MPRHPLLTDEEVLSRARVVFVERGYGAARTKQIAAAVGLTWGAIALRFGDKRALFQRAMGGPLCSAGELECEHAGSADLASLLQRVRARLWERWPLRLQYCLATPATQQTREPDPLLHGLAAALEAHARRGSLRADLSAKALAQLALALLIGDVVQRFAARETTLKADPAFIDGVVRLLRATEFECCGD